MTFGVRTGPRRTWRWAGPGRSIRRSSGPSRWRRTSAAPGRAWRFHGPATSRTSGAIRTQFHHMIDIVPTILEATGIQAPVMVDGIAQKPIEGVSMAYTFDKANANAPSRHTTQYFEMVGNRAIYHDGWIAATTPPEPPWALGPGQVSRRGQRLHVGALQPRRGLFGEQRSRRQDARQAARHEGTLPGGGDRNTTCSRWTTVSPLARLRRDRA